MLEAPCCHCLIGGEAVSTIRCLLNMAESKRNLSRIKFVCNVPTWP